MAEAEKETVSSFDCHSFRTQVQKRFNYQASLPGVNFFLAAFLYEFLIRYLLTLPWSQHLFKTASFSYERVNITTSTNKQRKTSSEAPFATATAH